MRSESANGGTEFGGRASNAPDSRAVDTVSACTDSAQIDAVPVEASAPSERRRMRPEDRRNAVLDAALRVFADAGFRRASLAEVSDEAGVTKGCLYHYFDSKGDLLLTLMRERSQRASDNCLSVDATTSRNEALSLMVRSLWRRYEKEGQLELTTVALTELPHAPEIARTFFDEVVSKNRVFLQEMLQRARGGEGRGEFATGCDNTAQPSQQGLSEAKMSEPTEPVRIDLNLQKSFKNATVTTDNRDTIPTPAPISDELIAMLVPYMVMGAALGFRLYRDIGPRGAHAGRDGASVDGDFAAGARAVRQSGRVESRRFGKRL